MNMLGSIDVVDILNPIDPAAKKRVRKIPYRPGLRVLDFVQERKARGEDIEVLVNNELVTDWTRPILPGDFVCTVPVLHDPITGFLAMMIGTGIGMLGVTGAGVALVSTAIAGVMVGTTMAVVGGLLMSVISPSPGMPSLKPAESPTYSWSAATNPENEGGAIPVAYGSQWVSPTVIGRYIEIDADGDQWAHVLLCVHAGLTNNVPTAEDILANGEPLTVYDDYTVKATSGSFNPDTSQLDKFEKLHQMRGFQKYMKTGAHNKKVRTLLHLNGTNGSTTIADDSGYGYTWSCNGAATLTTTGEKFGTACLDATGVVDYVHTLSHQSMWLFESSDQKWDLECWIKTPDNTKDNGIAGQQFSYATGDNYFWGFVYEGGNLEFHYWKDPGVAAITVYFSVSAAWAPANDTWYHLRVAHDDISGTGTVKIWVNGTLLVTGVEAVAPVAMPDTFTFDTSGIGRGYKDAAGVPDTLYGQCYIDEVRIATGQLLYPWEDSFVIPTAEVSTGDSPETYRTRGAVDELTLIFECPYGLYRMNDDAEMESRRVDLLIEYRKVGGAVWTDVECSFSGTSRYPVRKQENIVLPERAQYDVKVQRLDPISEDTRIQERAYWIVLDEILDEFVRYNGLQCVQISIKAQDALSGTIPPFKVLVNRSLITVTGLGAVDATVHANVVRDMFTNPYYGPGVALSRFDDDAFDDWEDWTTATVDGYARAQFNMIFDAEYDLDRALQFVEESGRAKVIPKGTRISAVIDQPTTPGALYSAGNIVKDSFILTTLPQAEKIDRVEIQYNDVSKNGETLTAPPAFASYYNTLTRPPRVARMFIPSINNEEQAIREAILKMQQSEALKRVCEFSTGRNGMKSMVGDTFYFQHDGNIYTAGGLIKWDVANSTTVYIDQAIELVSADAADGYQLIVQKQGTDAQVITDIAGPLDTVTKVLTLDSAITVSRRDVWMVCRKTEDKIAYRLTTVSRQFDQAAKKQQFALKGALYTESAYYNAAYGGGVVAI